MPLTTEMHLPSETKKEGHVFTYVGQFRYTLTLLTRGNKPVFIEGDIVRKVLEQLAECARAASFEVFAYCFLPDRLVLVLGGKEDTSDLRVFLKSLRSGDGTAAGHLGEGHHLWSRRYLERVVRKGEDMRSVVRDVFRQPVRAGLAKSQSEYRFQGSFTGLEPRPTSPRGAPQPRTASRPPGRDGPRRGDGGRRGGLKRAR